MVPTPRNSKKLLGSAAPDAEEEAPAAAPTSSVATHCAAHEAGPFQSCVCVVK